MISVYSLRLVCEKESVYSSNINEVSDLVDAIEAVFDLSGQPEENMVMLAVNVRGAITGAFHVSKGSLTNTIVTPREVFKRALLHNASAIFIAHNHPSGDTDPSNDDLELTKRLVKAGGIIGVKLNDHLIVGRYGHYSIRAEHPELFSV